MVQFTATVLLERHWQVDAAAVAKVIGERFPAVGHLDAVPGRDGLAIHIDGADVALRSHPDPLPAERLAPPMRPLRGWDAEPVIRGHAAHLDISCGGDLRGIQGAKAFAAVVHLVASAVVELAPALGVFWREGWALSEPRTFADAASEMLTGRMPLGAWVSVAMIVPKGYAPERATGMVTHGLRPFIGRELELAPRPGEARSAWRCIATVGRLALDQGVRLADGHRIGDRERTFTVTVRERDSWLRRGVPAYLLVADDSIINATTLKLREPAR